MLVVKPCAHASRGGQGTTGENPMVSTGPGHSITCMCVKRYACDLAICCGMVQYALHCLPCGHTSLLTDERLGAGQKSELGRP